VSPLLCPPLSPQAGARLEEREDPATMVRSPVSLSCHASHGDSSMRVTSARPLEIDAK
jgi:hypothetical protein